VRIVRFALSMIGYRGLGRHGKATAFRYAELIIPLDGTLDSGRRNALACPMPLLTGVGRAYLAFCPERERENILQRLRKSDKPDDQLARDQRRLDRILAETRQRGYATRDPGFVGGYYGGPPFDDGLAAIAVPLRDKTRVHGSINILWIKTAFTIEGFAARHLADLKAAAAEIVDTLPGPTKQSLMRVSSRLP